ncbi:unnamed protein product, partial [Linum tenue]
FILHCISSLQTHKGKQSRVTSLRSLRSSDSGVSSTGTARKEQKMVGSTPGVWSPTHEDDDDDVIEVINIESDPEIIDLSTPEMEFENEEWFD